MKTIAPSTVRRRPRGSSLLLTSVMLLLVPGCGLTVSQKAALEKFSAATVDLATLAADEFAKTRGDVMEMNAHRMKLGDHLGTGGPNTLTLEENLTLERVMIRTNAANALKEYGELLATLLSHSEDGKLKAAADSFTASLRKVDGVTLTKVQAGAIGQAIVLGGGILVEGMRAEAVRKVIPMAQPHVSVVVAELLKDFDPANPNWAYEHERIVNRLMTAATRAKPQAAAGEIADAALVEEAGALASRKAKRFTEVSKAVREACSKLKDAEEDVMMTLESPVYTARDIDVYFAYVEEAVRIWKILKDD